MVFLECKDEKISLPLNAHISDTSFLEFKIDPKLFERIAVLVKSPIMTRPAIRLVHSNDDSKHMNPHQRFKNLESVVTVEFFCFDCEVSSAECCELGSLLKAHRIYERIT